MSPSHRKILTCKALSHVLEPLVGDEMEVRTLDIALHVDPQKLKARLLKEVAEMEGENVQILLGYGLCGRALEGVFSASSTLVLPRIDDCVGALLGSREKRRELLKKDAGCYFLDEKWLDSELNIFTDLLKGLERIPPEKRDKIIKMMLKNYHTLVLFDSGDLLPETESTCRNYAERYNMDLVKVKTELGLLGKLINGPWNEDEFLVLPPGKPVPFF
jgi:hypothetical protein